MYVSVWKNFDEIIDERLISWIVMEFLFVAVWMSDLNSFCTVDRYNIRFGRCFMICEWDGRSNWFPQFQEIVHEKTNKRRISSFCNDNFGT